jgi:hypothetical protein
LSWCRRCVQGEDWEEGFANGLLNSLCFFPVLSYGSTAPLADIPEQSLDAVVAAGWDERPAGRRRLEGRETDAEDNVLKEFVIAVSLLDRRAAQIVKSQKAERGGHEELSRLQVPRPFE